MKTFLQIFLFIFSLLIISCSDDPKDSTKLKITCSDGKVKELETMDIIGGEELP